MELLFALFMIEKELITNNLVSLNDSPIGRGYLPLQSLSEKYGYAKDYVGWLSRTGRIEAVRHGKYGQWYASEESLKKYQLSLIPSSSKAIPAKESQLVVSESKPETSIKMVPLPADTVPFRIEQLRVETPTTGMSSVLLLSPRDNSFTAEENIVLYKNEGSYSAENPERINAVLTLTIVLGGILFFTLILLR